MEYQENIDEYTINNLEDINLACKTLPLSFYHNYERKMLYDNSKKVLVPKYILNKISRYKNIAFPIILYIINESKKEYFGVIEFLEDIDHIYIPNNIFYNLNLVENEIYEYFILKENFVKGNYIKLQPFNEQFYEIQNVRLFLETYLKKLYILLDYDLNR